MNKRHRASSSSLFLMELILAILIFCMAGAVCVSIFATSHTTHKYAGDLNICVEQGKNIAEIIRSSNNDKDTINKIQQIYSQGMDIDSSGTITLYFDDKGNSIAGEQAIYYATVSPFSSTGNTKGYEILMYKTTVTGMIFDLEVLQANNE